MRSSGHFRAAVQPYQDVAPAPEPHPSFPPSPERRQGWLQSLAPVPPGRPEFPLLAPATSHRHAQSQLADKQELSLVS